MSRSAACRHAPCSKAQPKGNYVMIKGSPTDPNANFLRGGQQEVIASAAVKPAATIKIVGEEYTDGWKPEVAQKNMEQIITQATPARSTR